MKAILKFNLPEEKEDYFAAIHGMDWALVVWNIEQLLRDIRKCRTNNSDLNEMGESQIDALFDKLREIMDDHGVNLDMIS